MNNIELNTALLNMGYRYMGVQKDKSYVKNATVAYTSLGVGFVSVLLSIISLSVGWNWFYLIHIALWVLFLVGLSLFVVFNTSCLYYLLLHFLSSNLSLDISLHV